MKLHVVVAPVILATQEVEIIRRLIVQGQLGQKVFETPSQPIKSWVWWSAPVISVGSIGGLC
jgi:hypothetical protein